MRIQFLVVKCTYTDFFEVSKADLKEEILFPNSFTTIDQIAIEAVAWRPYITVLRSKFIWSKSQTIFTIINRSIMPDCSFVLCMIIKINVVDF